MENNSLDLVKEIEKLEQSYMDRKIQRKQTSIDDYIVNLDIVKEFITELETLVKNFTIVGNYDKEELQKMMDNLLKETISRVTNTFI